MRGASWLFHSRSVDLGLRIAVGAVFVVAGLSKVPIHSEFIDVVLEYALLPSSLARLYGLVLPWLEIVIGSGLILGLFTRFFSILSLPVIVSFAIANVSAMLLKLGEECGCVGDWLTLNAEMALTLDVLLFFGAGIIIFQRNRPWAVDRWLGFRRNRSDR